eukprot:366026-Chlamydomonas_euryale.AAC.11
MHSDTHANCSTLTTWKFAEKAHNATLSPAEAYSLSSSAAAPCGANSNNKCNLPAAGWPDQQLIRVAGRHKSILMISHIKLGKLGKGGQIRGRARRACQLLTAAASWRCHSIVIDVGSDAKAESKPPRMR